ncbi:hypothetical protein [Thermosipho africanus]|uniref:hypothetical protein n=1 Tax=Thermosipho africanus TaxID=2421 RepID=UPI00031BDBC8
MIYEYDNTIPFNLEIENYTNYTLLKFDTVYEPDIPESKKSMCTNIIQKTHGED